MLQVSTPSVFHRTALEEEEPEVYHTKNHHNHNVCVYYVFLVLLRGQAEEVGGNRGFRSCRREYIEKLADERNLLDY